MGVNILPILAEIVSMMIIDIISFRFKKLNILMVIGTKVISATSLVTNIEKKKTQFTKMIERNFIFLDLDINFADIRLNIPSFINPATTTIRQNKIPSTEKSM